MTTAGLAFVSCGGDDDSTKSSPQPQSTTAASPTGDSSKSGSQPSQATATKAAGDGQVTGSGADALKRLAQDLSGKTYQVSYDINQTQNGKPTKGAITIAQKPPKSATNYAIGDSSAQSFLIINDGTNSYICSKDASGAGNCVKSKADSSANNLGNAFSLDALLKNLTENLNVTESGSRNIGGIDSRCFDVKGTNGSEGTACFSKKDGGATLLDTKSKDGSTIQIQATKASGSVDDSLFVPPAGYKIIETGR